MIPALLRRFHEAVQSGAAEVTNWGTGSALREFLHVDDMAAASIHVMNLPDTDYKKVTDPRLSHINVGTGIDCSIKELVETIAEVTRLKGEIQWDTTKPNGAPRKLMDNAKLKSVGWQPQYDLLSGLKHTYHWYIENITSARS